MALDNPVKTGIIAFGVAGKVFHAPFLQHTPGFHLAKISTSNRAAAQEFGHLYPQTEFVQDAQDILTDPSIELVVIGTPNELHYPLSKQALEAGKHVLVEKPFTIKSEDAYALVALARRQNRVICVNHNRRYDSGFNTIKKVIASGRLGHIVNYEAHFDRYRPALRGVWREQDKPGAGILYDLGSHLIDQAITLFGLPHSITATILKQRAGAAADDYFHLQLHHNAVETILHAGMLVLKPGPTAALYGTDGCFIKYGMDVQEEKLKQGEMPVAADWGVEPADRYGTLYTMQQDAVQGEVIESERGHYGGLFQNLYEAIRHGKDLYTKPQDAAHVIRIIEAAMQSHAEKCTVSLTW